MPDDRLSSTPDPDVEPPFVVDDEPDFDGERDEFDTTPQPKEEHLNTRHIRAVSLERRAIYRNRTYVIVATLACVGGAGQSVWLAYAAARGGDWPRVAAYAVLAVGLLAIAAWFARKIKPLTAEAAALRIPDPETPPDFSTLSSGGQFADALEQMILEERNREK